MIRDGKLFSLFICSKARDNAARLWSIGHLMMLQLTLLQRRAAVCAFVYLTANGALQVIVLIHFSKWAIANTNHFIIWRAQCNCWRLRSNHRREHISIFSFSFYSVVSHYSRSSLFIFVALIALLWSGLLFVYLLLVCVYVCAGTLD